MPHSIWISDMTTKKRTMNQESYQWWDTVIKGVGFFVLCLTTGMGVWQYHYAQEREFMKSFYDKEIDVVNEVFGVLSEVQSASTDSEREGAVGKFWLIYHGKARTFLDAEMFQALQPSAEYIASCISKTHKPKNITCSNYSASMSAAGFARVAREQLSDVWSLSFSDIGQEDPWSPPK